MKFFLILLWSLIICFNVQAAEKNYVWDYALPQDSFDYFIWRKDPTTFKKLIFKKEKIIRDVSRVVKRNDIGQNKKKTFRSFNFTAEYEDNITVELFVEYNKDVKNFEKAEKEALYYANMFGQVPHFLKTYTRKIYIHRDIGKDDGTWWVMYDERAFHINRSRCSNSNNAEYSECYIVMMHELAHVLQLSTALISPSKWRKARNLDKKKYCSKYGKKNSREDFAESILCWIGVRHKPNKIGKMYVIKINQFIPNRLKLFDEMNFNMYPYKKEKN